MKVHELQGRGDRRQWVAELEIAIGACSNSAATRRACAAFSACFLWAIRARASVDATRTRSSRAENGFAISSLRQIGYV